MGIAEHEPITGVHGQSPWSGGAKPPWSWKHFGHWMFNGAGKFSPFPKILCRNPGGRWPSLPLPGGTRAIRSPYCVWSIGELYENFSGCHNYYVFEAIAKSKVKKVQVKSSSLNALFRGKKSESLFPDFTVTPDPSCSSLTKTTGGVGSDRGRIMWNIDGRE